MSEHPIKYAQTSARERKRRRIKIKTEHELVSVLIIIWFITKNGKKTKRGKITIAKAVATRNASGNEKGIVRRYKIIELLWFDFVCKGAINIPRHVLCTH